MERSTAAKSPSSHAHCGDPGTKWCSVDITCGEGRRGAGTVVVVVVVVVVLIQQGYPPHLLYKRGPAYHHTHASQFASGVFATSALPAQHPVRLMPAPRAPTHRKMHVSVVKGVPGLIAVIAGGGHGEARSVRHPALAARVDGVVGDVVAGVQHIALVVANAHLGVRGQGRVDEPFVAN